jgi:tetratricopeptide (TPR) repeat protein
VDAGERACELFERALALRGDGRPAAALRDARRALAIFLRIDGPRSGDAANVLVEISSAEQDLGRIAASLDAAEHAWRIVGPVRGRDDVVRRLRANVLVRLAGAHVARGAYEEARRAARRALAIAETLEDDDVASAAMAVGVACKHAARFAEAARAYARVDAALAALGSGTSVGRATLLHNLGGLAHARARWTEGVAHARRGLAMRERLVGRHHPDVAADLAALAALLDGAGRSGEAARAYRRARAIYERAFGARHMEVGFVAANLAALEHGRGRLREAERLYTFGIPILERALGEAHAYAVTATHNLALLRLAQGRSAEAIALLRRAVRLATLSLGAQHADTAGFRRSLAEASRGEPRVKR